jgi:hypothetical protein
VNVRVIATADLYYRESWRPALEKMLADIRGQSPDLVLLAGDLGESLANFEAGLDLFVGLGCPVGVIAGNRDLWNRAGPHSSLELWKRLLPEAVTRRGFVWLETENIRLGKVGVCGSLAWYDYSGRDPKLGYSIEDYQALKGLVCQDAHYIDWDIPDRTFASVLQADFAQRLQRLADDDAIMQIMVITHSPVFPECVVTKPGDTHWNFGNAYYYNLTLGRMLAAADKVTHVISGHTRQPGQWQLAFGNHTFEVRVVGGYDGEPNYITLDL